MVLGIIFTFSLGLTLTTVLVYRFSYRRRQHRLQTNRKQAEQILQESRQEASSVLDKAKEEAFKIQIEAKKEVEQENILQEEELHNYELQVEGESQRLELINKEFDKGFNEVNRHYQLLEKLRYKNKSNKKTAQYFRREMVRKLQEIAGLSKKDLVDKIKNELVEKSRNQNKAVLRETSEISESEFVPFAKRIIGISIGRITRKIKVNRPPIHAELSNREYERLLEISNNDISRLEEILDIKMMPIIEKKIVTIKFDTLDAVNREICRRVLEKLPSKIKTLQEIKKLKDKKSRDMDNELLGYGRKAFKIINLKPTGKKELLRHLGRLYFRTSYTQNQWVHSIEAAQLIGLIAHELDLDVRFAKRAALLHDIGKSLTHIVEGSHALIGAKLAEDCGENELIVNAIASHHGDKSVKSLYSTLVMAVDALSGARPGARKEFSDSYFTRIQDLTQLASRFKGVKDVSAVQAGRELRIELDNKKVKDKDMSELAHKISEKISDDIIFPGQIKVTLIRKFKSVEIAK
ncbi:MAG: Rnase Y domain-containing protein [Deltaproteobacteria bacterium]|jgi:ribonuclease Y|nr:Rnase Y domain-containing protein [Deltaproteobacteria bacterium]